MLHLPYCEFYITHTCNLSCSNCHTFNNLPITGHSNWKENQPKYQTWARKLDIDRISLIGGEPLLNPDFEQWLVGIADLWPRSHIKIYTNGSQFDKWPNLYSLVSSLNQKRNHGQIWFVVSLHDNQHLQLFHQWLDVNDIKPKECYADDDRNLSIFANFDLETFDLKQKNIFTIKDHRQVIIQLRDQHSFHTNALQIVDGKLKLFNSDPDESIKICKVKTCHHMRDGALHKCGPVGVLPKIIDEFDIEISPENKKMLQSYLPAESTWSDNDLSAFINDLNRAESIPQCKFCPDRFEYSPVNSLNKKIMWQKYNKKRVTRG
jgi:organic radical activating enzyme